MVVPQRTPAPRQDLQPSSPDWHREHIKLIKLNDGNDLEYVDWPYEPRHELLLENTWTRIYIANIPPGGLRVQLVWDVVDYNVADDGL